MECRVETQLIYISRISKTAVGSGGLPYCVYRKCAVELSHVLSCFLNYSINKSVVPQPWKRAVITPVLKTVHVSSSSDLRPISGWNLGGYASVV